MPTASRDIMCPTFVRQLDRIASCSAAELYDAIFERTRLYRQVQSRIDDCDIVAMPTLSRSAVPIDRDFFGPIEIDGERVENISPAKISRKIVGCRKPDANFRFLVGPES